MIYLYSIIEGLFFTDFFSHSLKCEQEFLTNEEILSITKILLESRSFNKDEINTLINKLLFQATPSAKMNIKDLILNERHNYIPPRHDRPLIHLIWELSCHISNQEIIEFDYTRQDKKVVHRTVKPLTIMFSEYYFYLIAWFANDSKDFPAIFRVDRITNIKNLKQKFNIPYRNRFSDGEFRKRVQFMYAGELKHIKFEFNGPSVEAILDRIPTAEIIKSDGNKHTIKAECYGDGVLMWLRTQGDYVKML